MFVLRNSESTALSSWRETKYQAFPMNSQDLFFSSWPISEYCAHPADNVPFFPSLNRFCSPSPRFFTTPPYTSTCYDIPGIKFARFRATSKYYIFWSNPIFFVRPISISPRATLTTISFPLTRRAAANFTDFSFTLLPTVFIP